MPTLPLAAGAQCEHAGDRVTITTTEPEAQLRALLSWARRRGVGLSGLEVRPPSLEEIYLGLVGPSEAEEA